MIYLTEDLVSLIKLSGLVPVGQATYTDPDDFITLLNEELELRLVPHIMKMKQNFFLTHKTSTLVDKLAHYPFPERAIGNTAKDLFYAPDSTDLTRKRPVRQVEVHDQQLWQGGVGDAECFYPEGDEVVIIPTPNNPSGLLYWSYHRRPNKIVPTSSCAKITGISSASGTTTFTVNTDLTGSLSVGSLVDFLSMTSPFMLWTQDVAITAITSTTIAVATANVQNEASQVMPVANDYICPAQQANIAQIPQEFHPVLPRLVVARILNSLGFTQRFETEKADIKELLDNIWSLTSTRVDDEVAVVFDQNSILNSMDRWGFWPLPK